MPRIRAVHPRAPHDEDYAEMDIHARYLWDRLPCYADREGRLEDRPLYLKGEVFPADNVSVNAMLIEFEKRGFILRYSDGGRRLIQIVSWHDYQRPDRKERDSVLPPPDGWKLDKRGKWMWDKTHGCEAQIGLERGPGPVPFPQSTVESENSTGHVDAEPGDDRPRDRSGNPVIRYSGNPVDPPSAPARDPMPLARVRPRTAHDLIHMLKVAVEKHQPENGMWNPGPFGPRDAREFLDGFGDDLEEALDTIEARIELFAADATMSPWTMKKFSAAYNGIGQTRAPVRRQTPTPPSIQDVLAREGRR